MQKVKIIITALHILFVISAFHHTNQKSGEGETVTAEQVYMNQLSDQMPYIIPNPMVGFPFY